MDRELGTGTWVGDLGRDKYKGAGDRGARIGERGPEAVGQDLGSGAWIGVLGTKTGDEVTRN